VVGAESQALSVKNKRRIDTGANKSRDIQDRIDLRQSTNRTGPGQKEGKKTGCAAEAG